MSKYVKSLKSARPEHMYVLDVTRADLDGGTVSDEGHSPVDATVDEDSGFAVLDSTEALIDGLTNSVKFNVLHDIQSNNAGEYFSLLNVVDAESYFGPDRHENWSVELVFRPSEYNRGRYYTGHLVAFNQSGIDGLSIDYDFTDVVPTFQFVYTEDYDEEANLEILRSESFAVNEIYHVVLVKVENSYRLYVDGVPSATGTVDIDYTPAVLNSTGIRIGGWHSRNHSDATIQSIAFFDKAVSPNSVKSRFEVLSETDEYAVALVSLAPYINYIPELDGSVGNIEPEYDGISTGANSVDLYENENQELMIQTDLLGAGAVSKEKTLKFDLSGLTAGIGTYLDTTTTTDANSSVVVEYSFDDTTYSTFTEGADTVAELDANWGGAA